MWAGRVVERRREDLDDRQQLVHLEVMHRWLAAGTPLMAQLSIEVVEELWCDPHLTARPALTFVAVSVVEIRSAVRERTVP